MPVFSNQTESGRRDSKRIKLTIFIMHPYGEHNTGALLNHIM